MADLAVILCLNRVSFICLYLFMCHEVPHHILEYPFKQKPFSKRLRTSHVNVARCRNTQIWSNEKRIQATSRTLQPSSDIPFLLLNQPTTHKRFVVCRLPFTLCNVIQIEIDYKKQCRTSFTRDQDIADGEKASRSLYLISKSRRVSTFSSLALHENQ